MEKAEVLLSSIRENPFNSRINYDNEEIESLAHSMKLNGLLTPIKLRRKGERYEVVFGHRRFRAAKILGWESIRAEIEDYADQQMLQMSLIENFERKKISDYETGLCLLRMNQEFDLTYEEIGKLVGYSKSHVCNYIRMANLFDSEMLKTYPDLVLYLCQISEHHSRILLQVKDEKSRASALKVIVSNRFSVKESQIMLNKLRVWFSSSTHEDKIETSRSIEGDDRAEDRREVLKVLSGIFQLPYVGDFSSFANYHAFDKGYTVYPYFPPQKRFDRISAREKEREWFYLVASNFVPKLKDVQLQFIDDRVALATLYVDYKKKNSGPLTVRGTMIFTKIANCWKVFHEHWSRLEDDDELNQWLKAFITTKVLSSP